MFEFFVLRRAKYRAHTLNGDIWMYDAEGAEGERVAYIEVRERKHP